jgi:hypothetical protein
VLFSVKNDPAFNIRPEGTSMASRISFIFFQIVPLVAALWIPTFGAAESQARCPTNLSYLEKVIPRYPGDPDITEMRNKILQENISLDLDRAHQQGYSTAQAAKAALDQAREAQRVEAGVKQTALSTCPDHDTNPGPCEKSLADILQGSTGPGPLPPAYGGYVAAHYATLANREIAAAFACLARQNP